MAATTAEIITVTQKIAKFQAAHPGSGVVDFFDQARQAATDAQFAALHERMDEARALPDVNEQLAEEYARVYQIPLARAKAELTDQGLIFA